MSLSIDLPAYEFLPAFRAWGEVVLGMLVLGLFSGLLYGFVRAGGRRGTIALLLLILPVFLPTVWILLGDVVLQWVEGKFSRETAHYVATVAFPGFGGFWLLMGILAILVCPAGFLHAMRDFFGGIFELFMISPRRLWALTMLTFKESVRRKALLVIVVFGVFFLFASWFLPDATGDEPRQAQLRVQNQVSFVMTTISYLVMPAVFLLACWGLPDDIKARSLHTVVTKPVLRLEVLLGRLLGVIAIGTLILVLMGTVGYIWLNRIQDDQSRQFLVARRPQMGGFKFRDKEGRYTDKGINVGDLWEFRGYVEGNTPQRAIWQFHNVRPERFGDTLEFESTFQSFRTFKGNMDRGLLGQMVFVKFAKDGKKLIEASTPAFEVVEFIGNKHSVPRKLVNDIDNQPVDLFNDVVDEEGRLTVEVRCLSGGQFIGMARPDLFISRANAPYWLAFGKALFGIWLLMVLLIGMGVSASCFLKGPVATLVTATFMGVGMLAGPTLEQITRPEYKSGIVFQSVVRLHSHINPVVELDNNRLNDALERLDRVPRVMLNVLRLLIPQFEYFNVSQYIAKGFDVPWSQFLLYGLMGTVGFLIPCLMLGHFSLRSRELESK